MSMTSAAGVRRSGPALSRRVWPVLVLSLAGALVSFEAAQGAGELTAVKQRGKLIVGLFPMQGREAASIDVDVMRQQGLKIDQLRKSEQFKGIDIDFMKGFADYLGVELEIHAFANGIQELLGSVAAGTVDVGASGLAVTPERQKIVDFSQPYYSGAIVVAVRRDSKIATVADLAGKTAAVLTASSQLELLRKMVPTAKVVEVSFFLEGLDLVDEGAADYSLIAARLQPGDEAVKLLPNLKVAFRLTEQPGAFAVRQGSDLVLALNDYIDRITRSGELARILDRYGAAAPKARTP
jgi:polar amino acid transport system substrate-binding protein